MPAATSAPARCGFFVAALTLRFGMNGDRVVRIVLCIAPSRDVLGMLVRRRLTQDGEIERGAEARVRQRAHPPLARARPDIGSASCRERGGANVTNLVVAVNFTKH